MRQLDLGVADVWAACELAERLLAGCEYIVRGDAVVQPIAESERP
ncbi:MAG TPA: hypothetical protein VNL98_02395 [Gemmatimonadales bacterium]|nr:hypothetical protein [Gemmatimonadales bacterium]